MADYSDYRGDSPGAGPPAPVEPPPVPRLTIISYAVLTLLALVWPLASFLFVEDQLNLAQETANPITEIYLPTMAFQLATLLIVAIAVRSERDSPSGIGLGRFRWWSLPVGITFLVAANFALMLLQNLVLSHAPASIAEITPLLPHTSGERSVWALLCVVVAFSEEITFRGYLITRLALLTGNRRWIGVLISSVAFASGHLYQGFGGFLLIFVYGLMFSALFLATRSLYPGIIAHFLQDIAATFVANV